MTNLKVRKIAVLSVGFTAIIMALLYFLTRATEFTAPIANPKLFFLMQILSRFLIIAFGAFLLIDDLFVHNLVGSHNSFAKDGVVAVHHKYLINGFQLHHGYIGAVLVFLGALSIFLTFVKLGF